MSIHLYRPQRTAIKTLLACNVGRGPIIGDLLEDFHARTPEGSRQHYMLIGPRGIGKTTLLRLIAHHLSVDADLAGRYLPVVLAEEAYGITRVSDLMVEMARILSQDLGREELAGTYAQVRHEEDDQRVVDTVLDALRAFHRTTGLGLVLMYENCHRFMERQKRNRHESHILRKIMMEEAWLTGIFTSPTYLNAISDHREPFFEFFKVITLGELSPDQLLDMLGKLTEEEDNQKFREYLRKHSSRVRALYHFTGGNPRLAVMLYDLVTNQDITGVREELDHLLDQITPFYQDRMKDLSDQEAKALEAMSLIPEGCLPKDLASQARMEPGATRMLLTRLERAGYIRREKRGNRKTVYYIPERLFRIWNAMNNSRGEKKKCQYLVDFFSAWYATEEERKEAWEELAENMMRMGEEIRERKLPDVLEYMSYMSTISPEEEKYENILYLLLNILPATTETKRVKAIFEVIETYADDYESQSFVYIFTHPFLFNSNIARKEIEKFYVKHKDLSFPQLVLSLIQEESDMKVMMQNSFNSLVLNIIHKKNSALLDSALFLALIDHVYFFDSKNSLYKSTIITPFVNLIFKTYDINDIFVFIKKSNIFFLEFLNDYPNTMLAFSYITNNRSPSILEPHSPELREAALLLVQAFDSNPANKPASGA